MLAQLTAKAALSKVGISSSTFDFSSFTEPSSEPRREPNKLRKRPPQPKAEGDDDSDDGNGWGSWMSSMGSLPLTVRPWLAPPPPPVSVGAVPNVGDTAPADRDRKLRLGGGSRTLVVFLRCVGCAFAQKTFLNLRTIANRYNGAIRCVAVSHSSAEATKKWIDMLGGSWAVDVVIDEDRAIYAAWGLGLGNMLYLFHPAAQMQAWKEKGWLGEQVAEAVQRRAGDDDPDSSAMGNKWQEAGAFAVDGKGTVVWGGKALRSDDVMNLDEGAQLLTL